MFSCKKRLLQGLCTVGGVLAVWSAAAQKAAPSPVRIALVGDSTQTDAAGYGRGFCANLLPQVTCLDLAKGGASTRTYREQGLWQNVLQQKPDYILIQFGHNDRVSAEHLDREVALPDYRQNLIRFVTETRSAGITPILVTPLSRRYFEADGKIHSDLTAYAQTMRDVASQEHVPLIELQNESIAYMEQLGETRSTALGSWKRDAAGALQPDKTHLNWDGSYAFGRMVAVDLGKAVPRLKKYVRPQAEAMPWEGILAMEVLQRKPFKMVLVGDSTVAIGGGWGPGFCSLTSPNVTCVDVAANGRSSKSYIDEGLWQKALEEHGQYVLIQFGHNDQKTDPARHTDPAAGYRDNLRRMIQDVRAQHAVPVVLSPLSRRTYHEGKLAEDGLQQYADAARAVAAEQGATFLDLFKLSQGYLSTRTQAQADTLDATGHPDAKAEQAAPAKPDRTHLNDAGKIVFGQMVARELVHVRPEFVPDLDTARASALTTSSTLSKQ